MSAGRQGFGARGSPAADARFAVLATWFCERFAGDACGFVGTAWPKRRPGLRTRRSVSIGTLSIGLATRSGFMLAVDDRPVAWLAPEADARKAFRGNATVVPLSYAHSR